MPEEPTATARFRAELTGAWAEFLASLFFVFFGAGSVCGAVKAVGEPVVVSQQRLSFIVDPEALEPGEAVQYV